MMVVVVAVVDRLWKTAFSKACVKVEGGGLGASFAQAVRRTTGSPCGKVGLGGGDRLSKRRPPAERKVWTHRWHP